MLIVRLAFKNIVEQGVRSLKSRDLFSFMGPHRSYNIREYKLSFKGLIVQEPGGETLLIEPGTIIRLVEGQEYCKWHNGPIDRRDDPLERKYCINLSRSSLGYCSKHLRSDRALYDRCVSGMGNEALEACRSIDKRYRNFKHVVYVIVMPTGKVKVGITRMFRIYERIAEQQHLIATQLVVTESVLEARKIELKIAGATKISDRGLRGLVEKANITIEQAYNILENSINNIKNKLYPELGLGSIHSEFFRILPSKYLVKAEELKALDTNKEFVLKDYWGGYLFLEDHNRKIYAIKTTKILHKKSLLIL